MLIYLIAVSPTLLMRHCECFIILLDAFKSAFLAYGFHSLERNVWGRVREKRFFF